MPARSTRLPAAPARRTRVLALVFCLVLAFSSSLVSAPDAPASVDEDSVDVIATAPEPGAVYNLATKATLRFAPDDGSTLAFGHTDDGIVSYDATAQTFTGLAEGDQAVSCTITSPSDDSGPSPEQDPDASDTPADAAVTIAFTIHVIDHQLPQSSFAGSAPAGETFPVSVPLPLLDENSRVEYLDDSYMAKKGWDEDPHYLSGDQVDLDGHAVRLDVRYKGTHKIRIAVDGRVLVVTVKLVNAAISDTWLVMYPGKGTQLSLANVDAVTWSTDNDLVATVDTNGKVRARQLGICNITASFGRYVLHSRIEVTTKKAYKAVQNGYKDMATKLVYSQSRRMGAKYRDCSSFVSRCYWDAKLKRKILTIGKKRARTWAYTAADQAKWMNATGRAVAKKAVSCDRLLPGDTVHFETDYAGRNRRYRHIDHVGLYVGNGLVLNTHGRGGTGTIGYRTYYVGDPKVRFLGRPAAQFMLNRAALSVGVGKKATLKPQFAKGKKKVTWKVSDPSVASISKKGVVTGKAPGTAIVTARNKGVSYKCRVTVR